MKTQTDSAEIEEWDEDEFGLVYFVTEFGHRWFAFRLPDHVDNKALLQLQDQLREVIQPYTKENPQ